MKIETLLKFGWKPIVSEAQANQLLRRDLKHHANWQQRDPDRWWDYRRLLMIQKGNWYATIKNKKNGYCKIVAVKPTISA
jgi:hypothetical protein